MPSGKSWQSFADLDMKWGHHEMRLPANTAYTDGSLLPGRAGAAALLSNGDTIIARCPGRQSIYKSELIGITMAATHSPPGTKNLLRLQRSRYRYNKQFDPGTGKILGVAWSIVNEKHHTVTWIKAHVGHQGNEQADLLAKAATKLPANPPPSTTLPMGICLPR